MLCILFPILILVTFNNGQNQTVEFPFVTYGRMQLGMCEIQPTEGIELKTPFEMTCRGFSAPDQVSIRYSLYARVDGECK